NSSFPYPPRFLIGDSVSLHHRAILPDADQARVQRGAAALKLRTTTNLLVVEAKQEDLTNGFTQMAVELIALDQWEKCPSVEQQPQLFGAV
ncbi:MAG: hypothetical protein F6K26_33380, partial [Moorea sp. SIO2I5]|nr:hypothetical protein [Moorena sp. SIO2I5]